MRWTPTSAQAELLIDMLTARLPAARIAQRLNIDVATLKAYLERLAAAEDAPCP
jgi:DNA-binding CsgD family transcriptional regulator